MPAPTYKIVHDRVKLMDARIGIGTHNQLESKTILIPKGKGVRIRATSVYGHGIESNSIEKIIYPVDNCTIKLEAYIDTQGKLTDLYVNYVN